MFKLTMWLGLALGICHATGAIATNLISNPNFDTDISGWNGSSCLYGGCSWDNTNNVVGASGSGSLLLQSPAPLSVVADEQCVNVVPNTTYDIGGWMLFPTAQHNSSNTGAQAEIRVDFYSGANCSGSGAGGGTVGLYAGFSDAWTYKIATTTAPPTAVSALIQATISIPGGNTTSLYAYFDGILFEPDAETIAGNVIVNPKFDAGISGWNGSSCLYGGCSWDSTNNVVGASGSGSLLLQSPAPLSVVADEQCVNVVLPNKTYYVGGWMLFPTAQHNSSNTGAQAEIRVDFYSGANCSGSGAGGGTVGLYAGFSDAWTYKIATTTAPPTAVSALIQATISIPGGNTTSLYAYFDGILFGDSIFANGFE